MKDRPYNEERIAVLGAGESGVSAALLLAGEGAQVTVYDSAGPEKFEHCLGELTKAGVRLLAGTNRPLVEAGTRLCVLSPGIDPGTELVAAFREAGVPMRGELEVAYERCVCPVVAITGTNGKTTTTQLVEALFKGAGVGTKACGNIGPSFSRCVGESSGLQVMTVEVSSFQLESISRFRPRIAVWLNFAPDHLDRYPGLREYREAKLRIFENQSGEDWAVLNKRDRLPALKARTLTFSAYESGGDFDLKDGVIRFRGEAVLALAETCLSGLHNAENLMAALGVGRAWGLQWVDMLPALRSYRALAHRCEVVASVDGVEFVNDSKATNLDAVEKALESEKRPVVLIAGGKDKGFEYASLRGVVAQRCRAAVLIGEMAARIESDWSGALPCVRAASLREAVQGARSLARKGDVVLLSPGTSSFDMFRSYADRGNQFRAFVEELARV